MKNKALTYVLLLVVGLIWYQVFYRVADNLFPEDSLPPDPNSAMMAMVHHSGSLDITQQLFTPLSFGHSTPGREEQRLAIFSWIRLVWWI